MLYYECDIPLGVVLLKNFSYICNALRHHRRLVEHFHESVFVLSEVGNVEVFDNNRMTNNTLTCAAMWRHAFCVFTSYCSSVGIASFIVVKVFPQPLT